MQIYTSRKFFIYEISAAVAVCAILFVSNQPIQTTTLASTTGPIRCEAILAGEHPQLSRIRIKQYKSTQDRTMSYYHKPAPLNGRTLLFIHGLGENKNSLYKMIELAEKDGFGVLAVDLNGHGETLNIYLQNHKNRLPNEFDYRENVIDIKKLIKFLKLKKLSIIGHSYGGGIALKLAEELPKNLVVSVHAMAPYVQRVDKFLANQLQSPLLVLNSTQKLAELIPNNKVSSIFDPIAQMMWNMTKSFRYMRDLSNSMWGINQLKDLVSDPTTEKLMTEGFRKSFLKFMDKSESDLSADEVALLDLRVEAAIMVTKGIRGLDYLDTTQGIGLFPDIVQIFSGEKDLLVSPNLIKEFGFRLDQYKVQFEQYEFQGAGSDHMFPQNMPDQVYYKILEKLTEPDDP